MSDLASQIRYLRECYRENGSRAGLRNIYASSVRSLLVLSGSEPLLGHGDNPLAHYLRSEEAGKLATAARLSAKERDLVYGAVFLLAWIDGDEDAETEPEEDAGNQARRLASSSPAGATCICAPLFLFPASMETRGLEIGAHVEIDATRRSVNLPVLEQFGGADFARKVEAAIAPDDLSEGCVGAIRRLMREEFPESDTDTLLDFPRLISGRALRAAFAAFKSDRTSPPRLLPSAALALVNKSTEMRGVLNELDEMAVSPGRLSAPVRALLGCLHPDTPTSDRRKIAVPPAGRVPATLSAAQSAALESARRNPLTLLIGPPGTGKSFTVAALAIETLSRGGSVLIASRMNHAVDVVGNKIENAIGIEGAVIRGGRKEYLRNLKAFIRDLLSGVVTSDALLPRMVKKLGRQLDRLEKDCHQISQAISARIRNEKEWGDLLSRSDGGFFFRLRRGWAERRASKAPPLWEAASLLQELIDKRVALTVDFVRQFHRTGLKQNLERHRPTLQIFAKAIRSRSGTRQEEYFKTMPLQRLLGTLPIWLVNLSDVHRVLPLQAGAFDLAIIDEATQCDIASPLPILQRARHAVITGDPRQLRHVSFLPVDRMKAFAARFGLDDDEMAQLNFRDVSLIDLASDHVDDQSAVCFLNEHFRSQPEIIAFSNREFYRNQLHVMTGYRRSDGAPSSRSLEVCHISGGKRTRAGHNAREAKAVIAALEDLVESQSHLPPDAVHTLGILCPFRAQVDYLERRIMEHPAQQVLLERHQLLLGTAHTFQGEERDVVLLSLALDDDSPSASYRFLDRPDVFNVSITRARLLNRIYHSFSPESLKPASLLARYLAFASEPDSPAGKTSQASRAAHVAHDAFAAEVAEALREAGAEVVLGHEFAGLQIDVVFTTPDGVTRGVDLIGFPGAYKDAFTFERLMIFRRAGLVIVPLPYTHWLHRREECLAVLSGFQVAES